MDNETAWRVRSVVLSTLVLLVVAVPLYPELFGLDEVTPFPQLVAFRPQMLVVALVVGLLLLLRWRLLGALLLLLTLTGVALAAPRAISDPEPPEPGSRALTVMVANVYGGGADPEQVAKLIRGQRPDLVSLPEAKVDVRERIQEELTGLGYHGYTVQANSAPESATSVLVSATLGKVEFTAETLDPGRVNAAVPSTEPPTGKPEPDQAGVVQQTTTRFGHIVVTGGTLGNLRLIAYHGYPPLPSEVTAWKQDLVVLRKWCSSEVPTIVAGDFNATTDHADFRDALGKNCRSVGPAVGEGLQGTWPADRPAFARTQIDHVVAGAGVEPSRFKTYEIDGTDHRAVVAAVAVAKAG
ncbi:endonuclease/exonuclease/phosphatase family protein [Kribbella italica]|uniref:Endonuclease/exonuclease/phosphatase (EEP) superfamily protein YafD n=1 Tax=Kribbella italica TaxID=1540520 RepID=A0A7W9J7G8_9ACTN|nr:endonuclease/exonuclease/phosphatase family protein [Kribbella italica]MBB5837022.1 endonuclease/exonuclease/phosphatase (EEP) superfamily protein YafD [Kribbella italica]